LADATATVLSEHQRQLPRQSREQVVGAPYRPVDETAKVCEREPFDTDPEIVERGTRAHARLQNTLAAAVAARGHEPLRATPTDPQFDLAWRDGAELWVAEVKSTTAENEERQLRLGLGQLLRYRHSLGVGSTPVRAMLYVEHEPHDHQWAELCQSVEVTLRWPTEDDGTHG
jgi:hypothetical protein